MMSSEKIKTKNVATDMKIRIASSGYIPALRELFAQGLLEKDAPLNDTGADLDHLVAGYFDCEDSCFWVAAIGEIVVGMIGVQRLDKNSAEMRRLRVHHGFRRQGIGTRLMEHAISFCRKKDFLKVVLDVRTERVSAISLFDNFGFINCRERELGGRKIIDFYLDLYTEN